MYMKEIPRYEGYMASMDGHIWDSVKQKWLSERPNKYGYPRVVIHKRNIFVHKLVALAYIPNPEGKPTVNHINEIKDDNTPSNLEWMTYSENNVHGTRIARCSAIKHGRCKVVQLDLDGNVLKEYRTKAEAARAVQCNEKSIRDCLEGRTKTCKGYGWKRVTLPDISLSLF